MNTDSTPAMFKRWPDNIRELAKPTLLFGIVLYTVFILSYLTEFNGLYKRDDGYILGGDFVSFWSAAWLALHHKMETLYDLGSFNHSIELLFNKPALLLRNFSYPPFYIFFIVGFGLLPYPFALAAWLILTFLGYAISLVYKMPESKLLFIILILAPTTFANFEIGQNGFLTAALLVAGLRLIPIRPILSGILLGCLTVKPQLGLLVPIALLSLGAWRTIIASVLTVSSLIILSLVIFGVSVWHDYIFTTLPFQFIHTISKTDMSVASLYSSPFMSFRILHVNFDLDLLLSISLALLAAGLVVYSFQTCRNYEFNLSVLLFATFLISPYMFFYDLNSFAAAIVFMLATLGTKLRIVELVFIMIAWCLPPYIVPLNKAGFPIFPLIVAGLLMIQFKYLLKHQVPDQNL